MGMVTLSAGQWMLELCVHPVMGMLLYKKKPKILLIVRGK